jgi:tetratricopeptide (TPR) repeat protein
MERDISIVLNLFVGFLFIILPLLPGGNPLGFTWVIVGIFLIIIGTTGLYNKGSFPRNVYRGILSLLALIELFLIIYIYINMPESHSLLFLIILGATALLLYIVVYTLINKRKISKWIKGVEPVENDIKYQESLDYFDKYVKSDPNDLLAWAGKAIALLNLNKYEEALECSNKSSDINLGINNFLNKKLINSIRLNVKGIVLSKLKRYEEALSYFDQALELRPSYYSVLNNKGIALSKLENYEEAINCYNKVLRFDPKYPHALSNKGETLRKLGKHQEAMEYVDKALEINSKLPFIWLNKGETLMAMNRNEEAIKYIDKSLELDPIFESAIEVKEKLLN